MTVMFCGSSSISSKFSSEVEDSLVSVESVVETVVPESSIPLDESVVSVVVPEEVSVFDPEEASVVDVVSDPSFESVLADVSVPSSLSVGLEGHLSSVVSRVMKPSYVILLLFIRPCKPRSLFVSVNFHSLNTLNNVPYVFFALPL